MIQSLLDTIGLTREDLNQVGIVAPGTMETGNLIDATKSKVRDISDVVTGKVVPKLQRAGVLDEATQHASARIYVPALVEDLLAKVFPDKYKDGDAMARTIDIINKDNILGGYDDAQQELAGLRESAAGGDKAAAAKIPGQEQFIKDIEGKHDLAALDADVRAAKGTEVEEDIHRWEKNVVPVMDQLYNEMKNADPDTPRESRGRHYAARVNLLDQSHAGELAEYSNQDKPLPEVSVSNYRNPNVSRDKFARQAKLTGKYSDNPNLVLLNSLASRWNQVTKIRLYNALVEKGAAIMGEPGEPSPKELGGKPVGRMPIKFPETGPDGRTRMVEKSLFVQRDLVDEIKQVLDTDGRMTKHPLFHALTQVQLLQLADATSHLKNIHMIVANSLGSKSMVGDIARKIPGISTGSAVTEVVNTSREIAADSPAIRSEIAKLAKNGMIRPAYPPTGIQRITRMQELIHNVDTAARVIMNRRFDNLVSRGLAKDTFENRRNFIQQIGEYNRRLMRRYEAMFRDAGLSPFIVAGRTMNRYARRMVTGDPGFQTTGTKAQLAARTAQLSGLVMATTLPAMVNTFTTGSMFGRPGTPIGAIDFGPRFDTKEGKRRGMDLFQLIGLRRGLRATGADAVIEGIKDGKTENQIAGDAIDGIKTTTMHPWIGPGVGAMYQTATGQRLDLRSGWNEYTESRKIDGGNQYVENARIALKQQNPLLYGIFQSPIQGAMEKVFGLPPSPDDKAWWQQTTEGAIKAPLSAVGYKEFQSPALQMVSKLSSKEPFTPQDEARYAVRRAISQAASPEEAAKIKADAVASGTLTKADIRTLEKQRKQPDLLTYRVKALRNPEDAISVFRVATQDEQSAIYGAVLAKIKNSTSISEQYRETLRDELDKASKEGIDQRAEPSNKGFGQPFGKTKVFGKSF